MAEEYPLELVRKAMEQALTYNTLSYQFLKGLLQIEVPSLSQTKALGKTIVPPGIAPIDIHRGLASYQTLIDFSSDEDQRGS